MKLIALTKLSPINLFDNKLEIIKLNPDKIISIKQEKGITKIYLKNNTTFYVKETLEKIKELIKNNK